MANSVYYRQRKRSRLHVPTRRVRRRTAVSRGVRKRVRKSVLIKRRVKRRRSTPTGTSGDVVRRSYKYGRKMPNTVSTALKLTRMQMASTYYMFKAISDYKSNYGEIPLGRFVSGTWGQANSSQSMPAVFFNLTNNVSTTNAEPSCSIPLKYYISATDYTYTFGPRDYGYQQNGTAKTNMWLVEKGSAHQNNAHILDWLNIKLDCVGATTIPTRWSVMIVQFKDRALVPEILPDGSDQQALNHRNMFYENFFRSDLTHPMNMGVPEIDWQNKMRVLYKKNFMIQPKQSVDLHTSGDERWIKIFKRLNRTLRYDWADEDPMIATGTGIGNEIPSAWISNTEASTFKEIQKDVDYTKRIYLIVKCNNAYPSATTGRGDGQHGDVKTVGSFDICMRRKVTSTGHNSVV